MTIYDSIQSTMSKKGINPIIGDIYDLMSIWKQWYRGNVNDFHYYNVHLADGSEVECERLTMNMPKKICEDFAKLLWSEKVQINLDSDKKTERLWQVLDSKKNNFSVMFPSAIERSFAMGTGALIEYKVDDETIIEYIDGDNILPYKYTNSYINGFISMSQFTEGQGNSKIYYTHLTFHEYDGIKYIKYNELYRSKDKNTLGKEISFEEKFSDVQNPVVYVTDTPHFQILRPLVTNNFDFNTPMGISIFANSLDKFKAIDTKYDSFNNEFELGKKMVLVDRTAIKTSAQVNTDGSISNVSYFDKKNKVFQAVSGMENQPVKEIDFKLRHQEHIDSINADLNYLSAGVGLGQDYYKFDGNSMKTATEVVSENSDTYRAKVHHQIMIKDVLYDLIKSVMFLEGIKSKDITISFDDSIIEDENSLIERGLKLLEAGTLSTEMFMEKYLHYDETQIQEEKAKIMNNLSTIIKMLDAEIIDSQKAIEMLFADLPEEDKARMIANTGSVSYEEEEQETPENE